MILDTLCSSARVSKVRCANYDQPMTAPDRRRALLLAGLGFPQVREPPPEVATMRRQGYVSLTV
jgi:hypothetical protein